MVLIVIIFTAQKTVSMKKVITPAVLMCAMTAMAVEPAPQPEVDDSMIQQLTLPEEEYRGHFGINFAGGISNGNGELYDTDIYSIELELAYDLNKYNAVTMGMSLGVGSGDESMWLPGHRGPRYFEYDYTRSPLTFMLGYRLQLPVTKRITFAMGVKGGLDIQSISLDYYPHEYRYDPDDDSYYNDPEQRDHKVGLVYAGYAGINFKIGQQTSLEVGYQFRASTARPEVCREWEPGCPTVKVPELGLHEVRVGLRFDF